MMIKLELDNFYEQKAKQLVESYNEGKIDVIQLSLAIYRLIDDYYLSQDAANYLAEHIGYDLFEDSAYNSVIVKHYYDNYGFNVEDLFNKDSERYILDKIVERFRNEEDCTLSPEDQWKYLVSFEFDEFKNSFQQ